MVQEAIHDEFVASLTDESNLSNSDVEVDELTVDSLNNELSPALIFTYSSLISTILLGMGWYIFRKGKSSDV